MRTQGNPQNYPQSYILNKEQERELGKEKITSFSVDLKITSFSADLNQLNKEETNRLKEFLKTIQDGGVSCSIAQNK